MSKKTVTATPKETRIINRQTFIDTLANVKGSARFARILTQTKGKANVKSRTTLEPFRAVFGCDAVYKLDDRILLLNADYSRMVNGRREKEGTADAENPFQSKGTYGEMINRCLLRKGDGEIQLRTYDMHIRLAPSRWIRADGVELSEKEVERLHREFLPPQKEGSGRQGLTERNRVDVMNFKLDSIKSLTLDGVQMILADY